MSLSNGTQLLTRFRSRGIRESYKWNTFIAASNIDYTDMFGVVELLQTTLEESTNWDSIEDMQRYIAAKLITKKLIL